MPVKKHGRPLKKPAVKPQQRESSMERFRRWVEGLKGTVSREGYFFDGLKNLIMRRWFSRSFEGFSLTRTIYNLTFLFASNYLPQNSVFCHWSRFSSVTPHWLQRKCAKFTNLLVTGGFQNDFTGSGCFP